VSQKRFGLASALVLILLLGGPAGQAQETYKVIVNVANPVDALSRSEAARLFLTKTPWDSGEAAFPIDLSASSPVREEFSRDVLGMSASAAMQAWKKQFGDPPPAVASDREVLAFVRLKRGAIGYVSASANIQGVKVLTIVKPAK
jgi:ABC-type phosphate transport system substrate-binding protein